MLRTIFVILGLYARQGGRYGWAVAISSAFASLGHALMLYATLGVALRVIEPVRYPFLLETGLFVVLMGMALLGVATLLAGVLPRWCGVLLIIGYPLPVFFGIGYNAWAPYGWVPAVLWAAMGYALLSRSGRILAFRRSSSVTR